MSNILMQSTVNPNDLRELYYSNRGSHFAKLQVQSGGELKQKGNGLLGDFFAYTTLPASFKPPGKVPWDEGSITTDVCRKRTLPRSVK